MGAKIMKITYTDSRDGMVLIGFTDERGEHEIALSTIETADLIGALRTSLEEAVGSPAANSMGLPGIERVQIVETAEEVFFRVYMNDRISHDYPVPKGTVLADELRMMAAELLTWIGPIHFLRGPEDCRRLDPPGKAERVISRNL